MRLVCGVKQRRPTLGQLHVLTVFHNHHAHVDLGQVRLLVILEQLGGNLLKRALLLVALPNGVKQHLARLGIHAVVVIVRC